MPADLYEKTIRYEKLLAAALEKAVPSSIEASHMRAVAQDYKTMADSYHKDGLHFLAQEDYVNALASFATPGWTRARNSGFLTSTTISYLRFDEFQTIQL